jgi:hypothetical protein
LAGTVSLRYDGGIIAITRCGLQMLFFAR